MEFLSSKEQYKMLLNNTRFRVYGVWGDCGSRDIFIFPAFSVHGGKYSYGMSAYWLMGFVGLEVRRG